MADSTLVELFEETLRLAEEENATENLELFVLFIQEMLPQEILTALESTAGGDSFLEDIWSEKYEEITPSEVNEDDFLTGRCCRICERGVVRLTRHHLYPRETHTKMLKHGIEKSRLCETVSICRLCHSSIHRFFSNDELSRNYNTVDLLMSNEKFFKYAQWASKLSNARNGRVK